MTGGTTAGILLLFAILPDNKIPFLSFRLSNSYNHEPEILPNVRCAADILSPEVLHELRYYPARHAGGISHTRRSRANRYSCMGCCGWSTSDPAGYRDHFYSILHTGRYKHIGRHNRKRGPASAFSRTLRHSSDRCNTGHHDQIRSGDHRSNNRPNNYGSGNDTNPNTHTNSFHNSPDTNAKSRTDISYHPCCDPVSSTTSGIIIHQQHPRSSLY